MDLISTEKENITNSDIKTVDKDDCAFSVVYSLVKIKSKAYIFENIFSIFKWQNKSCLNHKSRINHKSRDMILLFTSAIASAFAECRHELERLLLWIMPGF